MRCVPSVNPWYIPCAEWVRSIDQSLEYCHNFPRLGDFHKPIPGIFPKWVNSIGQSLEYSPSGCGAFHQSIPGIFPKWVRSIGQSLESSPSGCIPLANPWNIPQAGAFYWTALQSRSVLLVHSSLASRTVCKNARFRRFWLQFFVGTEPWFSV